MRLQLKFCEMTSLLKISVSTILSMYLCISRLNYANYSFAVSQISFLHRLLMDVNASLLELAFSLQRAQEHFKVTLSSNKLYFPLTNFSPNHKVIWMWPLNIGVYILPGGAFAGKISKFCG